VGVGVEDNVVVVVVVVAAMVVVVVCSGVGDGVIVGVSVGDTVIVAGTKVGVGVIVALGASVGVGNDNSCVSLTAKTSDFFALVDDGIKTEGRSRRRVNTLIVINPLFFTIFIFILLSILAIKKLLLPRSCIKTYFCSEVSVITELTGI
jgi:hypothetical protein